MVMRAKKNFVIIAYDIANDKRRTQVMKLLEKVGMRINFSVFECMLTDWQYEQLKRSILQSINIKYDSVVYYPICLGCYSKIVYQMNNLPAHEEVTVV